MSEVNTYKAIGFLMTFLPEPVGDYMKAAQSHLRELADAYNALAPDWSKFSDDVQWYTIDCDGNVMVSDVEPEIEHTEWLVDIDCISREAGVVTLPIGIDWRLCKWSREGAK